MPNSKKKTSFSELSSLLQSSNHTQLRHSRHSSLKTARNLYTVPELGLEGSSPGKDVEKRKSAGLPVSSYQHLTHTMGKKRFNSYCVVSNDKAPSLKVVVNKNEPEDHKDNTLSNPISRYEYKRTYTTTPRNRSVSSIYVSNEDLSKSSKETSTVRININLNHNPEVRPSRTINKEYTFDTKFDCATEAIKDRGDDSDDGAEDITPDPEKPVSFTSSNQSPFTKKEIDSEPVVPMTRKDSASLEQFFYDLDNHGADVFTSISRTQLKLNHLKNKPSEPNLLFTSPEDIISLLSDSSKSSLSNISLTPQKDAWKVTAQGKFWVNNDLSSRLMNEQLGIQFRIIQRINYNNKNVLLERLSDLITLKKIRLDGDCDDHKRKKSTNVGKTEALPLEDFVSFKILETFHDFQEIENPQLRYLLQDGKKTCDQIWQDVERSKFFSYDPIYGRESYCSNVSGTS